MRAVLKVVLPSGVGVCVAIYLAAVGLNGDVRATADWWPYPWLWALAAIAVVLGVWWLILMLKPAASTESPDVVSASPAPLPADPHPPQPATAPGLTGVVEMGDMRATRAANGTWGVRWISNGRPVGTITPIGQGFYSARHIHMGDAGQHPSIEEALKGIWQVD